MNNENLYITLESGFPADRSALAIETTNGVRYTYADVEQASARYANLIAELAVRPGDRVAVQVEKSPEALFLYLGCLRAGAVFVPLNTAYKRAELAYFLGDAQPSLVVCDPASESLFIELAATAGKAPVLTLGEDGQGSLQLRAQMYPVRQRCIEREGADLAAILYTSGTTGRSKGAMLTHTNLSSNARVLSAYWRFRHDDVLLHALPIFHAHGLFVACHCALLSGSKLLWMHRFDADTAIALLTRSTVFMAVPTLYTRLLEHPAFDRAACSSMRLFTSGSAPLLAETHRAFEQRTGHAILERYGMTETVMLTSNPLLGARRAGTVGFPLPGVEVRIADSEGRALPPGEVGNVQVRGPNVFAGYWRMPDKTREEFTVDGFFRTGDLGLIDVEGYVVLVGRSKDLIISGGYNVYPKEIESYIDGIDGVKEAAVIGLPHRDFGEAVAAVVVIESGAALNEGDVIGRLKGELANFKIPKQVFFVDELPRNALGKVQKNLLRDRFAARTA